MSFFKHYVRPALKRKAPTPPPHIDNEEELELEEGELPTTPKRFRRSRMKSRAPSSSKQHKKPRVRVDKDDPLSLPSPVFEREESYSGLFQNSSSSDPLGLEAAFKTSSSFVKGEC